MSFDILILIYIYIVSDRIETQDTNLVGNLKQSKYKFVKEK